MWPRAESPHRWISLLEVGDILYEFVDNGIRSRVSSLIVFDADVEFYFPNMGDISFVDASLEELIREVEVGFV